MTCAKTQGFLAKHKVSVTEQTDAKKATIKGAAALGVLDGVDELYVAKGKKVEHVDLKKGKPDRATLLGLLLGPTGNLRAPTLRNARSAALSVSSTPRAVPTPGCIRRERRSCRCRWAAAQPTAPIRAAMSPK